MPKIETYEKKIAWIVSGTVGLIVCAGAVLLLWGSPLFDEYLLLAVVLTVFPASVLDYIDHRWKRNIDKHLPDLFRSIVQAQRSGMTLPQAVEEASKRNYGSMSKELEKMGTQMSWGVSFEDALKSLGKRVDTALMRQTVPLIIEAQHSGGQVEKVFEPLETFVQTILTFDEERKTQTRPYLAIIYVAFFVFLFTIIILLKSFFVDITDFQLSQFEMMPADQAKRLFFHMSSIQAFFGGLVAGKMGEGTVGGGLKHSVILLVIGYFAFKFIV
ncbi:MAG: type II secretion system F family protein [Candidatus Bathyarchaeota archaeon]